MPRSTNKAAGAPDVARPPYPGQERFSDGRFTVKDWSAELALQALDMADAPRPDQEVAAQAAEEAAALPPEALEALRKAGYLKHAA